MKLQRPHLPHLIRLITLCVIGLFSFTAQAEELRVVATLKPIHSLVSAVMQGSSPPQLLIKGAQSPHNYKMRPSDARLLSQADIIFWTGEGVELFLVKPLQSLSASARIINLSKTHSLQLLANRETEPGTSDAHNHTHNHAHETDPHFWLDIENAKIIVTEIVRQLSQHDKTNAKRYQANGARVLNDLNKLQAELRAKLAPVDNIAFLVFHDAFQYFEKRFNLKATGAVTLSPEQSPGARRLSEIRREISAKNIKCIFAEPQFKPALIKTVIRNTTARQGILDPIGADIPPGPNAYSTLLKNITEGLLSCLKKQD